MVVKKGLTGISKDYLYLFGPYVKVGVSNQIEVVIDFNLNRGEILSTEQFEFLDKMGIKYFFKGKNICKEKKHNRTVISRLKKSFANLSAVSSASIYKFKEALDIRCAVKSHMESIEKV